MKYKLIIDAEHEEEVIVTVAAPNALTDKIESLVLSYAGDDTVLAYNEDELTRLRYDEIECITVIDRRVYAIDGSGSKFRINQRLCELEDKLPSYFIRINKSTLANQSKIIRFKATFNGAVDACFRCGHTDYVSRRCFANIKRRFTS